jgi:mRNA interferase YafQ
MRAIVSKKRFKKDFERLALNGRDFSRLEEAIVLLQVGEPLPTHFRDHQLTGNLKEYRECHLGGDWLLLYQRSDEVLTLVRIGTHAELFD